MHSTASSLGYDTEVLLMGTTFVPNEDFVVEFKFSAMIIFYALALYSHLHQRRKFSARVCYMNIYIRTYC